MTTSVYLRLAFLHFRQAPARLAFATLLWLIPFSILQYIFSFLPLWWITFALSIGPFWVGYLYYLRRFIEGDDPHWNALFFGFQRVLFASMMTGLILVFLSGGLNWVLVSVTNLLQIPRHFLRNAELMGLLSSLLVWTVFLLSFPIIADERTSFGHALQESATRVWRRLPEYLGFSLICFFLIFVGAVTVVGILVALPIVGLAIVHASRSEQDFLSGD